MALGLALLTVGCGLLFFFELGARPLWDVDEGMHAATSKEILASGDWVTPTFNGEVFYDKPILFNWLVAISMGVLGPTELAARLPAALLGLGTVLMTFLLGSRAFSPRVGLLAGAILATSPLFLVLSRSVVHDSALVFFVTLALLSFYLAISEDLHRRRRLLVGYAATGLAVLAKGPLGLVLVVLVIGPVALASRGRIDRSQLLLYRGAAIVLAISAWWFVLMAIRHESYVGEFLLGRHLESLASPVAQHANPWYFYFPGLFVSMIPWSFFLPVGLFFSYRRRHELPHLFVLVWFVSIFAFFSLASAKLETYLLPLLPAGALLVAVPWSEVIARPRRALRRVFAVAATAVAVAGSAGLLYCLAAPPLELDEKYGVELALVIGVASILAVGTGLTAWFAWRRRPGVSFVALAGTFAALIVFVILAIAPRVSPYRSTRTLARSLDAVLPAGEDLVFYRRVRDSALFYTDRQATVLRQPEELLEHLGSDRSAFCLLAERDLERLGERFRTFPVRDRVGNLLLISNRTSTERLSMTTASGP